MSARRLNIGIRTAAERSRALREAVRRVARDGGSTPRGPELYFESVEDFRRILTGKRVELLMTIARHRPASVNELARLVGRDYKNISADIALLKRLGLIGLERGGEKRKAQQLTVPFDEIRVTIDLRGPHEAHTT